MSVVLGVSPKGVPSLVPSPVLSLVLLDVILLSVLMSFILDLVFKSLEIHTVHGRKIFHTWEECEKLIQSGAVKPGLVIKKMLPSHHTELPSNHKDGETKWPIFVAQLFVVPVFRRAD